MFQAQKKFQQIMIHFVVKNHSTCKMRSKKRCELMKNATTCFQTRTDTEKKFLFLLKNLSWLCFVLCWNGRKHEDECKTGVLVKMVATKPSRITSDLPTGRQNSICFLFLSFTPIVKCKTSERRNNCFSREKRNEMRRRDYPRLVKSVSRLTTSGRFAIDGIQENS